MLKKGKRLGKYRVGRRIAQGPFADVYQARDTIEGLRVALKVPHAHLLTRDVMEDFRSEVRLAARLDHPNVLPVKDASIIDSQFVIVFPLGERTLADRMQRRMSLRTVLDYADQMLDGVAHAHANRVIHCDIKPENFILFPGNRLRLTDFGIAKLTRRTVHASGSGTLGYVAPEQAMGKPSFRSDVFSLGLILYRMLSGRLPEWPYAWPPPGYDRLRRRVHAELIDVVRKAMEVEPRKRFKDAGAMRRAVRRARPKALKGGANRAMPGAGGVRTEDWQTVRRKQFLKEHGKQLETRFACARCGGPVAESMTACPWCGAKRPTHRDETSFPARCPRCGRGMKLDWRYCPWCYGPGFEVSTTREYSDVRYTAHCANPACPRRVLMLFMRYCPWCRRKVRRAWKVPGTSDTCPGCGWGVLRSYWDYCPWCGKHLPSR